MTKTLDTDLFDASTIDADEEKENPRICLLRSMSYCRNVRSADAGSVVVQRIV